MGNQHLNMRGWFLLLAIQVFALNAAYQNNDNFEQWSTARGGNGRTIHRAEFPSRMTDLCSGVENHVHNSGVKVAGTVYFPVGTPLFCEESAAGAVSTSARILSP